MLKGNARSVPREDIIKNKMLSQSIVENERNLKLYYDKVTTEEHFFF